MTIRLLAHIKGVVAVQCSEMFYHIDAILLSAVSEQRGCGFCDRERECAFG